MTPLISVIVELGTREVTRRLPLMESILDKVNAAKGVGEQDVELIFVGTHALPETLRPRDARSIAAPETGYYGWKNIGAAAARGEYLVFWDSDCRPAPGYLQRVVETLAADPELSGIAGRTVYDGKSFLSRLNTVLSFGYLARPVGALKRDVVASHNVAIRRSMFPAAPFGPFTGRVGGDKFLTDWARNTGRPLDVDQSLLILHEDPSWSITALLERHLRELFVPLLRAEPPIRPKALAAGWRSLLRLVVERPRKLLRVGRFSGFTKRQVVASVPVLALYFVLDALALLVLTASPRLLDRWLRWQFGS